MIEVFKHNSAERKARMQKTGQKQNPDDSADPSASVQIEVRDAEVRSSINSHKKKTPLVDPNFDM